MAVREVRREIGRWPQGNKVVWFQTAHDKKFYTVDVAGYNQATLPSALRGKFTTEKDATAALNRAISEYRNKHPKISKRLEEENAES